MATSLNEGRHLTMYTRHISLLGLKLWQLTREQPTILVDLEGQHSTPWQKLFLLSQVLVLITVEQSHKE